MKYSVPKSLQKLIMANTDNKGECWLLLAMKQEKDAEMLKFQCPYDNGYCIKKYCDVFVEDWQRLLEEE